MGLRSGRVAAIIRQISTFSQAELDELFRAVGDLVDDASSTTSGDSARGADARRNALVAMQAVAESLTLAESEAPTVEQFNNAAPIVAPGWNASRVIRSFGSWRKAKDAYTGAGVGALTARQRSLLRAARHGVHRGRADYIEGVRLWLAANPRSEAAKDYDAWRAEFNAKLSDESGLLVSYSMLRKALPWSWETTKAVARGEIRLDEAPTRSDRKLRRRSGPDHLIDFAEVRVILNLGKTAARNLTYSTEFPAPAYTHPRPPGIRLWRREDVERFARGEPRSPGEPNDLQDRYLDAHEVSRRLGLARITVTTRSSPRIPEPSVVLGGLQLWAAADVECAAVAKETRTT